MPPSEKQSSPTAGTLREEPERDEVVDDLDEALEVIPYTYSITPELCTDFLIDWGLLKE